MNFDWTIFITALGLAVVIEGLPYFLFPEKMPRMLLQLATHPPSALRKIGLTAIIAGLIIIATARGFFNG
ncbi:MAG: DUF2065 domain-containing protein [Desulfovibrio sp.]